jgi:integrase
MSIYRRKSGGYQVVVDYDPTATGGRRRRIVGTFATKKEAERAERDAKKERDDGHDIPADRITIAELAKRFIDAVAPDLAGQTASRYEEHLRMHILPRIGSMAVRKLKRAHLVGLYADLRSQRIEYRKRRTDGSDRVRFGKPLGKTTTLRVHRVIHRMLEWAVDLKLIARNVARFKRGTAPKAAPSPARELSSEQVAAFLDAARSSPYYAFFVVAAATGMRRGEIGALVWDAIDFERETAIVRQAIGQDRRGTRFIKPPKNDRTHVVPLDPLAIDALRRHRAEQAAVKMRHRDRYADQGLVFADDLGRMPDLDAVSKAFAAIATSVGIKARGVSLHSLRHFVATQALYEGNDPRNVAALLGHADASMVMRVYAHAIDAGQKRIVASVGDSIRAAQASRAAVQK